MWWGVGLSYPDFGGVSIGFVLALPLFVNSDKAIFMLLGLLCCLPVLVDVGNDIVDGGAVGFDVEDFGVLCHVV